MLNKRVFLFCALFMIVAVPAAFATGTIYGVVSQEDGTPVANALVHFGPGGSVGGDGNYINGGSMDWTDSNGAYTLEAAPAGTYYDLTADAVGLTSTKVASLTLNDGESLNQNLTMGGAVPRNNRVFNPGMELLSTTGKPVAWAAFSDGRPPLLSSGAPSPFMPYDGLNSAVLTANYGGTSGLQSTAATRVDPSKSYNFWFWRSAKGLAANFHTWAGIRWYKNLNGELVSAGPETQCEVFDFSGWQVPPNWEWKPSCLFYRVTPPAGAQYAKVYAVNFLTPGQGAAFDGFVLQDVTMTPETPVDTTPPEVTITPVEGTYELDFRYPIWLDVIAIDTDSGVAFVDATVNGNPVDLPYRVTSIGTYTLKVTAFDFEMNTATASALYTIIDTKPPEIAIVPQAGTYVIDSVSALQLYATAIDYGTGVARITATVNGSPATLPYQITAPGSYHFAVTVFDNAGNSDTQTADYSVYQLKWLPPVVRGNSFPFQAGSTLAIKFSVWDYTSQFVASLVPAVSIQGPSPSNNQVWSGWAQDAKDRRDPHYKAQVQTGKEWLGTYTTVVQLPGIANALTITFTMKDGWLRVESW